MVNFSLLVENILLNENVVGVPDWFNEILNKHKELFGSEITDEDLTDFFDLLDDSKISEEEGLKDLGKIRILDLMKTFYDSMDPKPKDLNEFKTNITNNSDVLEKKINNLKNLNKQNRLNWKLTNPKIIDLKKRSEILAGQKGADTLISEYGNDFIIPAVQKIVKKRVDFFTRISNLKSPTTPFANLILDVFKYPLQYSSGAKKYTSDFEEVDKFYIDNLIEISIAAEEFYASEMIQLKLTSLKQIKSQQQNVNAGLNLFELVVGQILNEANKIEIKTVPGGEKLFIIKDDKGNEKFRDTEKNVLAKAQSFDLKITSLGQLKTRGDILGKLLSTRQPSTPGTQSQTKPQEASPQVLNTLKQELLSESQIPNKINFYYGKPVKYNLVNFEGKPRQGEQLETTPEIYKINKLTNNPRAKKLINLLNQVAQYSKKKPGAGERLQQLGQAGQALAGFAGAKLYA
jgi:hypothetical protein